MLTSPANARVKRVVKLRARRHRDRERRFVIEGFRELDSALRAGFPVGEVFYCEQHFAARGEQELVRRLRDSGAVCEPTNAAVFAKLSYRHTPDGLLAVAATPELALSRLDVPEDSLWLVATNIEKPGNLGAMLRTVDAVGASGVLVADPATDPFNPNVVRASVGTLFSVPLAVAGTAEVRAWLADHGIRVVATSPDATTDYAEADLSGSVAIAVGGEHGGLDAEWIAGTEAVRIPMAGQADSINAAMTAAVLLFEASRQRRASR
ncbi:MAG: RNA methyltransferase [Gammaproteobacteria bacterium]|nr:RNA methyltransferase [Gammaproteobacteria bacterium]